MFSGWSKIFFASVYGFGLSVKANFFGGLRWRQFGNISTEIRKKSELQEWRLSVQYRYRLIAAAENGQS
jgi:hypothetical protein